MATGKSVVGLDIQPGFVAAVEARPGEVAVERAASAPLAPGVVRDGEILDGQTLASVLRDLFNRHKLGRRVRVGVANQRIVVRTVDLPPLENPKEIEAAVRFQAQDHIPMPLDQAVLEHQVLGDVETPDGPRSRVVLVAARRDMVERLLDVTRQAGLRPEGIDLSAFAMIRALHRPGTSEGTLYINVGGVTNLAVAVGTSCVFTRVIGHGVESIAAELAERRGLTLEHAHEWLKHVGMLAPIEQLEGDVEIVAASRDALVDGVRRITDEVRNSLDFHAMQHSTTPAGRAVITGPAIAIPGFSEQLGAEIGLPVEIGTVREASPGALGDLDAGALAVATGLTIEEVPA